MPPIRIGFIGISANSLSWKHAGAWANTAHLPYLLQSLHYTITAVCNSSPAAAQAAITSYNLPSTTKAYASSEELAAYPDIDLVICSVNVKKHYELIKPALLAGKDVIVEWPLGASLAEAEEFASIAKEKGCTTAVVLQARFTPVVREMRALLEEGRIGKVLSSTIVGACNYHSGVEVTGVE